MKMNLKKMAKILSLLVMGISVYAVQACSDDDPFDEGTVNGKKIAKIVVESEWNEYTHTFSYDDKRRLIKATYVAGDYAFQTEYIWGDNTIKQIGDGISSSGTYTLENGLIQRGRCFYNFGFTYNESNKFVRLSYYNTYTAIWEGNKLMSISSEESDNTFMYDGKTCKGFLPPCTAMFHMDTDGEFLFTAHPEIAGMLTNQLPSARICDGEKTTFTYEFDKDGYVSKIIEEGEDNEVKTIHLTWQ